MQHSFKKVSLSGIFTVKQFQQLYKQKIIITIDNSRTVSILKHTVRYKIWTG